MANKYSEMLAKLVVDRPWLTLFILVILLVTGLSQLIKVRPSVSYQDLLGPNHPKLIDYETIQKKYTRDDNLLVLIEALDGDAFDDQTLAAARQLTEQLWQTPYSIRVDSISNYQHSYADGDELLVGDLVPDDIDQSRSIKEIRHIAMTEPQLLNRATNASGNVVAVSVSFAFPNQDAREKLDAYAFVVKTAQSFESENPALKVRISGLVALDATVMEISQRETGLFLMLVVVIVVLLLAVFLRSVVAVVLSIFVCIFSILAALSLAGFMGWKLTPFTASVPLVVLIIAVADCVHLLTGYLRNLRQCGNRSESLRIALKSNLTPIAITSVTTAIGFLSLNFSESDSIHALGNEVAFGVIAAFVFSVSFLPAALMLLPQRIKQNALSMQSSNRAEQLTAIVSQYRFAILGVSLLIISGLGLSVSQNSVNDIIPHYFAKSLPWRQANDFAEAQFGGAYTFSWSLQAGSPGAVSDPEFLARADRFVGWLRSKPEVVYVNAVTDTFKRLNRNMNADQADYYRLPKEQSLASQYLLLYEMSLPFGLDLNNQIDWDKSSIRVQATFKTMSTSEILAMEATVNRWLTDNLPGIEAVGSGVQLMFAHMLNNDVIALLLGTTLGLVLISFCLVLTFRSVRIGLISLAPNLVPALLAFGVWGLTVGQVGMGLAMVSGMTIGIIVDDTVHFLYKYLQARRDLQLDVRSAITTAYQNVGPAIVFTTTVLVAGFMAMATLAEFRVNADMAKMTSLVLMFALVFDLIVLPALLMVIDGQRHNVSARTLSDPA